MCLIIIRKYLRHPLAYLMEAADSICYYVMDIEDGYNKELFEYDFIKDKLSKGIKDKAVLNKILKNQIT